MAKRIASTGRGKPSPYTKYAKREYDYSPMYSRLPADSPLRLYRKRGPEPQAAREGRRA